MKEQLQALAKSSAPTSRWRNDQKISALIIASNPVGYITTGIWSECACEILFPAEDLAKSRKPTIFDDQGCAK